MPRGPAPHRRRPGASEALVHLAQLALRRGDVDQAAALAEEGLALARAVPDPTMECASLVNLGLATRGQGATDRARAILEDAVARYRQKGFRWQKAWALGHLAGIERERGSAVDVLARYGECLDLFAETGDALAVVETVRAIATLAVQLERYETAARFCGAAEARRGAIGIPVTLVDQADCERAVARARATLGDAAFTVAWDAGRHLPMTEVMAEARRLVDRGTADATAAPAAGDSSVPAGLSAREINVLRLVAQGLTNAQIANRLFVSPRTVESHLRRIYEKIDVHSRAQATRFALEHGLTDAGIARPAE